MTINYASDPADFHLTCPDGKVEILGNGHENEQ